MQTRPIIIEQRLRTTWLASVLGGVILLVAGAGLVVAVTAPGRWARALSGVVVTVVLGALSGAFFLVLRVVVRIVDAPEGRALEVVYGPNGAVRQCFDHANVLSARVRRLSALRSGGWGYRGSLRLFKWAAVVTRGGDALEIQLSSGGRFLVTVDEPQDFVIALAL